MTLRPGSGRNHARAFKGYKSVSVYNGSATEWSAHAAQPSFRRSGAKHRSVALECLDEKAKNRAIVSSMVPREPGYMAAMTIAHVE